MSVSAATRKSIKKYFGLGGMFALGKNGPFTMHDVDDDLFPAVWSFIAEVLETEVDLSRLIVEELSIFYSQKNDCPICIDAHTLLEEAAKAVDDDNAVLSCQAKAYGETVYMATTMREPIPDTAQLTQLYPDLSEANRAEIALVLLVYQYMNRVVRALLGEHVSTAMFGVPRPVATVVESSKGFWLYKKMLKPFLSKGLRKKNKPGISGELFPKESKGDEFELPEHLANAELGGHERARSLARVYQLVDKLYYSRINQTGMVSTKMIAILDAPENQLPKTIGTNKINWALVHMPTHVFKKQMDKTIDQEVAQVLLLVDIMPDALERSYCWRAVNKEYGKEQARLLVFWWALRCTFVKQAKGLVRTSSIERRGDTENTDTASLSESFVSED
ncbi:unknown protein [Seminavis robusta]|uniref:Uncharacterized protein n=1 Tax=Seminavis robusta TaxID=568900 RepID=A0A9N8E107_9STRA|nr:unknown protein [Seminavis robusta]|eukprot:Sro511_g157530.1 n/a (390) ;mRNA; r:55069-56238